MAAVAVNVFLVHISLEVGTNLRVVHLGQAASGATTVVEERGGIHHQSTVRFSVKQAYPEIPIIQEQQRVFVKSSYTK